MDILRTAALRERVLAAWTAAPARFREDANAEEELALGAYRDRLVVELAQNAADAAVRSGRPGRLLLRLDGSTLIAANTGAALDPDGVEGLSTLRASPKRADDAVGRFGVGFAAVLAVTDEPAVYSHDGGVRWSRPEAHRLVARIPELADELARRGTAVPVLRLPFADSPAQPQVPAGYHTAVVLPLRDQQAVATVRELLDAVDEALPLVLPALTEIVVEIGGQHRTLTATPASVVDDDAGVWERQVGERRWRLAQATGQAAAELLADRPVEERMRPTWSVTVAVPIDDDAREPAQLPSSMPGVVHAPTPTDDATDLPVLVIGSFPLDSTRRRVAAGRLTDHLVEQTGTAYARLTASFDSPAALALVPGPIGVGELDTALHRAAVAALSQTAFIHGARPETRLRPAHVTLVDGLRRAMEPERLAPYVDGLPATDWWRADVLQRLGARVMPLSDLVDQLGTLDLDPAEWRQIYAAVDGADPEALGALPVPLADGRLVRGPRGVLLPGDVDPSLLEPFRLRVVHPDAAHPLLGRLGAAEATADSVLRDPALQVVAGGNGEAPGGMDARPLADVTTGQTEAILRLVAASGLTHEDEPWLTQLPLPDETGTLVPAHDLLLPGASLLRVLDVDPAEYTVAHRILERHGADALRAVGVRDGVAIVREADVPLDSSLWHDLDDEDGWVQATQRALSDQGVLDDADVPPLIAEFSGVRDLDLIHPAAWSQVLNWLATDPASRATVVEPVYALTPHGTRCAAEPYTAWWLREHVVLDGHRLNEFSTADADPVVQALLPPMPATTGDVDDAFAAVLGVARSLADVPGEVLLNRLGDAHVTLSATELASVYAELAQRDPSSLNPPAQVRIPDGTGSRVVDAGEALVCDAPHWLQLSLPAVIPGAPELADVLELDLASDAYDAAPDDAGERRPVPDVARALVPEVPDSYVEHDELIVAGQSVDWWLDHHTVHAATIDGLARGLAWQAGAWERRWLLAQALEEPAELPTLLAEDSFP